MNRISGAIPKNWIYFITGILKWEERENGKKYIGRSNGWKNLKFLERHQFIDSRSSVNPRQNK